MDAVIALLVWYDQKAAAAQKRRIHKARVILRQVCPPTEPLFARLTPDQLTAVRRECCRDWLGSCQAGINEPSQDRQIRCVYQPTLADLCWDAFDCVVVDEGVKMKGADTLIGQGVRKLCPPHRLVLTATPVKNRVPDLFWLAWWAAGGKAEPTRAGPLPAKPGSKPISPRPSSSPNATSPKRRKTTASGVTRN